MGLLQDRPRTQPLAAAVCVGHREHARRAERSHRIRKKSQIFLRMKEGRWERPAQQLAAGAGVQAQSAKPRMGIRQRGGSQHGGIQPSCVRMMQVLVASVGCRGQRRKGPAKVRAWPGQTGSTATCAHSCSGLKCSSSAHFSFAQPQETIADQYLPRSAKQSSTIDIDARKHWAPKVLRYV